MKLTFKNLLLLPALVFSFFNTNAQQWDTVGTAALSSLNIGSLSSAFYNDTLYASFAEGTNTQATVKKFDGTSWSLVGTAQFTAFSAQKQSLAIDHNGTIYLAYQDGGNGYGATVRKFDGTSWVVVGAVNLSGYEVDNLALAIDSAGTPYIGYGYNDNIGGPFPNFLVAVKKFDGTNWVAVGGTIGGVSYPKFYDIALNSLGQPHVSFHGINGSLAPYELHVKGFDGASWVDFGIQTNGITPAPNNGKIAFDSNDALYIAYTDQNLSAKATVKKCINSTSAWTTVGTSEFSAGIADKLSLAVNNNIPYLAFQDAANSSKTTVMTYNGTAWTILGNAGFSIGAADYLNLIAHNNKLYLGYKDAGLAHRATMMKYNLSVSIKELEVLNNSISVYPNPTNNILNINSTEQINAVSVLSLDGKLIKTSSNKTSISVVELPVGIYLIQVETPKGFAYQKFVKE